MENETKPQLFIMDEQLGNPIPLAELKEKGIRLIDEKPRLGAGGAGVRWRIACGNSALGWRQ